MVKSVADIVSRFFYKCSIVMHWRLYKAAHDSNQFYHLKTMVHTCRHLWNAHINTVSIIYTPRLFYQVAIIQDTVNMVSIFMHKIIYSPAFKHIANSVLGDTCFKWYKTCMHPVTLDITLKIYQMLSCICVFTCTH